MVRLEKSSRSARPQGKTLKRLGGNQGWTPRPTSMRKLPPWGHHRPQSHRVSPQFAGEAKHGAGFGPGAQGHEGKLSHGWSLAACGRPLVLFSGGLRRVSAQNQAPRAEANTAPRILPKALGRDAGLKWALEFHSSKGRKKNKKKHKINK